MARSLGSTPGSRVTADRWLKYNFLLQIKVRMSGYFSYSHQIRRVRKIFTIRFIACNIALLLRGYGCCSRAKENARENEKAGGRRASV